jgi:hypothetical protein
MPSPFRNFNRFYHHLYRWDEDVCPRRENVVMTTQDAADIARGASRVKAALGRYKPAERELIMTIAAGIALHCSGAFARELGVCGTLDLTVSDGGVEKLLRQYTYLQNNKEEAERVARALGLRKSEIEAVWAYTNANKEVDTFASDLNVVAKENPAYMKRPYGGFKDGWAALTSALTRLPNFGRLGLTVCTFRTVRQRSEIAALSKLPLGSRLVMGCLPMKGGQRHVSSTAITMSKWTLPSAVRDAGGLLCYFGVSGVFINWLGVYSMGIDGGESLYLPGTIMQLSARARGAESFDGTEPIFVLEEVPAFSENDLKHYKFYDDFTFQQITDASLITQARQSSTPALFDWEDEHDGKLHKSFYD